MLTRSVSRRWLVFGLAYIVLIAFLAWYDEPLNPGIAPFLEFPPPVEDGQNGYYALLGFSLPGGSDIHAAGIEAYKKYTAAARERPGENHYSIIEGGKDALKHDLRSAFGTRIIDTAEEYLRKSPDQASKVLRDFDDVLDRYLSLYKYAHFHEPLDNPVATPFPRYSPIRSGQTLVFVKVGQDLQKGKISTALHELSEDMRFWRTVLADGRMMVTKLISISSLRSDYRVLSEIIRTKRLSLREVQLAEQLLEPLKRAEMDLGTAMRSEHAFRYRNLEQMHSALERSSNIGPFLLKRHATANKEYDRYKRLTRLVSLPGDQFYKELTDQEQHRKEEARIGLSFLYNPLGQVLTLGTGNSVMTSYADRTHNLDILRRLVALQLEITKEGGRVKDIEAFLRTSGSGLSNPYTNEPMRWDDVKKRLYCDSPKELVPTPLEVAL